MLGILEEVVDRGTVPLEVRGDDGGDREIEMVVPEGERRALTEPGVLLRGLGFSFWLPPQPVVVGVLTSGDPAERAGLALGDRVVEIDGKPVADFAALRGGDTGTARRAHRAHGAPRREPTRPSGSSPSGGGRMAGPSGRSVSASTAVPSVLPGIAC